MYRSKWDDGHETESERNGGIPAGKMGQYAERYEDQEDVEPGAKEEESE